MRALWRDNRKAVLVAGGLLTALLTLLVGSALVIHASSHGSSRDHPVAATATTALPPAVADASPQAAAGLQNALAQVAAAKPVKPAVCAHYPAIPAGATSQPLLFAKAFTRELFSVDYRATARAELLQWAQYESAPYRENGVPVEVGAKMLLVALTDPAGDDVSVPPILPEGPWLSLSAQAGRASVTKVTASEDPDWQAKIAAGYEPTDPRATWVDISALVTLHTKVSGRAVTSVSSVSMTVMLGTSPRGDGYGATGALYYTSRAER